MKEWDGLLGWFMDQASADRAIRDDHYLGAWFAARARAVPDRTRAGPLD
jgi:hypothetical protein